MVPGDTAETASLGLNCGSSSHPIDRRAWSAIKRRDLKKSRARRPSSRMPAKCLLPPSLAPRGLSREVAAQYVGVSATTFDNMVRCGLMPKPKRVNSRKVWDRHMVDAAFAALPSDNDNEPSNPWDGVDG